MILIVGAGNMALEYTKVLKSLRKKFTVVGRGIQSAQIFEEESGIKPYIGGLESYCLKNNMEKYKSAIVTTGVEYLAETTKKLLKIGIKNILVEKPAGLNFHEIESLADAAESKQAEIYVAYNRRFYSSVLEAKKIIDNDGGVVNFNFELTEWGHVISKLTKPDSVKQNWFLANTSHVTDMAFFLGGMPKQLSSFYSGGDVWHSRSYCFSGAGVTEDNALFSYHGNWGAPGRWSLEVLTSKHRLIFCPLEKLQLQKIGSLEKEFLNYDDSIDINFKPGLYRQTEAFLNSDTQYLCKLSEHVTRVKTYIEIAGYL